jgi:hypothetical protein
VTVNKKPQEDIRQKRSLLKRTKKALKEDTESETDSRVIKKRIRDAILNT